MERASLLLSGGNISISDISKLQSEIHLALDPEALKLLNQDAASDSTPLISSINLTKLDAILGLNSLLRLKSKAHKNLVETLLNKVNTDDLDFSDVSFTPLESKIFLQKKNFAAGRTAIIFAQIKTILPILDASLALAFEAQNLDGGISQVNLYSGISNGIKTSINNMESLLLDSKLAKKNQPNEAFVEAPQLIGTLRSVIDEETKSIEREINHDLVEAGKAAIHRSQAPILKPISSIFSLLSQLNQNYDGRSGNRSEITLIPASSLEETLEILLRSVPDLIQRAYSDLLNSFSTLESLETKINVGAQKHRPILLGKGSKLLYTYLKENPTNPESLSKFLENLFMARNEEGRVPKLAKGMKDYGPEQMAIREKVFDTIRSVFKKHMAGELDTPVMELRETLTGKYGDEGAKLIYNIADQGGELLSLRYDLTVPLARYVAMNRLNKWKRYQIGKVYRRDQPQMKKGRFREFYQCDFDLIGGGATMAQDAEVLKIVSEILVQLDIGFVLKVSHRKLLDALLDVAGCPINKRIAISSAIDKLDKEEWSCVRHEMIHEKGITEECADKIGEFVNIKGAPQEVLNLIKNNEVLQKHEGAKETIQELERLAEYLECLEITQYIHYDLSLARGLDYYTGLVYEAVLVDSSQGVGSIAGGGRYDELIMKLNNSKNPVPSVGVALGIERIFAIIEDRYKNAKLMFPKTSVLVAQAGSSDRFNLMHERFRICNLLWRSGIAAETSYREKSDPKGQAGYASEAGIAWLVWVAESELDQGKVRVKSLEKHSEEDIDISAVSDYILRLSAN